jgi:SAM-dependent methyltransferase
MNHQAKENLHSQFSRFLPEKPPGASTGRPWELYIRCLKLNLNANYDGTVIIDVGSGYKESTEKKVADCFPGAHVIAVDPNYIIQGKGAYQKEQYNKLQLRNMATDTDPDLERRIGVVQELPAEDHSIDQVWSMVAVPFHLSVEHEGRMWAEILRVLKPGGEAHLSPYAGDDGEVDAFFAKLLRQFGYNVELYRLTEEDGVLAESGVILTVPEMTVLEAHQQYEAFKMYLMNAGLYAAEREWSAEFLQQTNNPKNKVESPMRES